MHQFRERQREREGERERESREERYLKMVLILDTPEYH